MDHDGEIERALRLGSVRNPLQSHCSLDGIIWFIVTFIRFRCPMLIVKCHFKL